MCASVYYRRIEMGTVGSKAAVAVRRQKLRDDFKWVAVLLVILLAACGGGNGTPAVSQQSPGAPTAAAPAQLPDAQATANFIVASAQETAAAIREAPQPTEPVATEPAPPATEVAVPTVAPGVEPIPPTEVTAAEIDLKLGPYSVIKAQEYSGTRLVGYVENRGAGDAGSIQIVAEAVNAGGKTVGTGTSIYNRSVIPGGERSPFYILMEPQRLPKYKTLEIQVQGEALTPDDLDLFPRAAGLIIRNDNGQKPADEHSGFTITGQVRNGGKEPAEGVAIVGIGYDKAGKPMSVGLSYTKLDRIAPGGSSPFSLQLPDNPRQIVRYDLYVEGSVEGSVVG